MWRRLLLGAVLEFAALSGAPLRPKDIEEALRSKNEIVWEKDHEDSSAPPSQ
jgi:hypothetical protein